MNESDVSPIKKFGDFPACHGRAHRIRVFLTRGSLFKCILLFLKLRVLKVPLVVIAHMDWMDKKMVRDGPILGVFSA